VNGAAPGRADDFAALAAELHAKALSIEADPFPGVQLGAADIGRAMAYRDSAQRIRQLLDEADLEARAEAGEDWNAPDREHEDGGDDDE